MKKTKAYEIEMITRQQALKVIKDKVDKRVNAKAVMRRPFVTEFTEGVFRHTVRRRISELYKDGNSVMWVDENHQCRNINMLDTQSVHRIAWQYMTEKEKVQAAMEHLLASKPYLEDY